MKEYGHTVLKTLKQVLKLTTEKGFLAIGFALEKFQSYFLGTKVIVYFDHVAICYLMTKKEAK